MNGSTPRLHPIRSPLHANAVVLPATLLHFQPQFQQLADALPTGTMIVVLGSQHRLVAQALTTSNFAGRRPDGRR
jgi:hypothetical protein